MDRTLFFKTIRPKSFGLFPGSRSKGREKAINDLIDAFETHGDGRMKSLAYILATVRREVGAGMLPVREGFSKSDAGARKLVAKHRYGKPVGPYGHVYYGRGYVQLTWHRNYVRSSADAGIDLERFPDAMLKSDIAAKITVLGILDGRFNRHGHGLAYYLPDDGPDDLKNARRTVNLTDHWEEIAGHYQKFKQALEVANGLGEEPKPLAGDEKTAKPDDAEPIGSIEDLIASLDPEESLSSASILISNEARKNLPRFRPAQKSAVTLAALIKFAHLIPEQHLRDTFFVLAVRGYYRDSMGEKGTNDRGIYDDAMFVIEPGRVDNFNGNTDPSSRAYRRAVLKAPQCVVYKPGLHGYKSGNPYPAFRQHSPVTVIRDGYGEDRDGENGFLWINLHRGGARTTSSAGCQTVPAHQWGEFKLRIDDLLAKHRQETFCYILIDEKDVPTEEATSAILGKYAHNSEHSHVPASLEAAIEKLAREILDRNPSGIDRTPKNETGGKKMRIFLFRGMLGGVFSRGMDALSRKLAALGHETSVHSYLSRRKVQRQLTNSLNGDGLLPGGQPVALIGHSLGADAANRIAVALANEGLPVAYVATIDPTKPEPIPAMIPSDSFQSWDPRAKEVKGAQNHHFRHLNHVQIDKDEEVHCMIINSIGTLTIGLYTTQEEPHEPNTEKNRFGTWLVSIVHALRTWLSRLTGGE